MEDQNKTTENNETVENSNSPEPTGDNVKFQQNLSAQSQQPQPNTLVTVFLSLIFLLILAGLGFWVYENYLNGDVEERNQMTVEQTSEEEDVNELDEELEDLESDLDAMEGDLEGDFNFDL